MANLDALAPNYLRAVQRWPGASTLANGYEALATCVFDGAHGLVEHVQSFVESVCLTIMVEYSEPKPSNKPSTTDLLVAALRALGLENTKGVDKLDKVLSGFNKLSDALNAMRNVNGPVAHGKDGFLDPVTADHARAFLHVGDAILSVLLNALEGKEPDLKVTREPYENFQHHNERIDRAVNVNARIDDEDERPTIVLSVAMGAHEESIDLRIEPSRLLYGIDRQVYIEALKMADATPVVAEAAAREYKEEEEVAVTEAYEMLPIGPVEATRSVTAVVPEYSGKLDFLRSGLDALLASEGVTSLASSPGDEQLLDSLLATTDRNMALDWEVRTQIQARLKVACKRVLVRFGIRREKADEIAVHIINWLLVQVTDDAGTVRAGSFSAKGENGP